MYPLLGLLARSISLVVSKPCSQRRSTGDLQFFSEMFMLDRLDNLIDRVELPREPLAAPDATQLYYRKPFAAGDRRAEDSPRRRHWIKLTITELRVIKAKVGVLELARHWVA
jgi:hypothetical protein